MTKPGRSSTGHRRRCLCLYCAVDRESRRRARYHVAYARGLRKWLDRERAADKHADQRFCACCSTDANHLRGLASHYCPNGRPTALAPVERLCSCAAGTCDQPRGWGDRHAHVYQGGIGDQHLCSCGQDWGHPR